MLVGVLFRTAMPRVAAALAPRKPLPTTKERLLAALEQGAWALPGETFADYSGDESWAEGALAKPAVRALLDRAVADAVGAQPG